MATTTILSSSPDDSLQSADSADYEAASGLTGDQGVFFYNGGNTPDCLVGNDLDGSGIYYIDEAFLHFDLAAAGLTAGNTVTAAALSLSKIGSGIADGDFDIQARTDDWGATLTTGDIVAGGSLGGLTLLASKAVSGFSTGSYVALTQNGTNFVGACNTALAGSGVVRLVLCAKPTADDVTPSGFNYLNFDSRSGANPPKLVLTYTTPAPTARTVLARQAVMRASVY